MHTWFVSGRGMKIPEAACYARVRPTPCAASTLDAGTRHPPGASAPQGWLVGLDPKPLAIIT